MINQNRSSGFTLIELMITVAIVAILATVAVSSYRTSIVKTNRAEAKMALLQLQTAEEKYFLQHNKYVTDSTTMAADTSAGGLGIKATTPNGNYTIKVEAGAIVDTTYLATATAVTAKMGDDTACLSFTIDDQNNRQPAASTKCW